MLSKETYNSIYIYEVERFGDKIIKFYSKISTNENLNCELSFNDGIPSFVVESLIDLFKKIPMEFICKKMMHYDKNFNVNREIKLFSTEVDGEYYLLNEIADIKICRSKENELEESNIFE